MELILFLIGVIYITAIAIFSVLIVFLPSIINVLLSFVCVYHLKRYTSNLIILIPVFLIVSVILGVNVRIPEVLADISNRNQLPPSKNIKASAKFGSPVSLSTNMPSLSFKENPLSNTYLDGDEGCMCTYYVNPDIVTERFEKVIRDYGFVIDDNASSNLAIDIHTISDEYLAITEISIIEGSKTIASNKIRIRQRYKGDTDLDIVGRTDEGSLLSYFTKNTFWNYILRYSGLRPDQDKFIEDFLSKHISIESGKKETIELRGQYLEEPTIDPNHSLEQGRRGDIVRCPKPLITMENTIFSNRRIYLNKGNKIIPIEHNLHDIEKIICVENKVYLLSARNIRNHEIAIHEYSFDGKNLSNYIYKLPHRNWLGYPRKPLIYFEVGDSSIIIGLQQFGKNIDTEHFYYSLERREPNKASNWTASPPVL